MKLVPDRTMKYEEQWIRTQKVAVLPSKFYLPHNVEANGKKALKATCAPVTC